MPEAISTYASLKDLHDLWLSAATGKPARGIRTTDCPVEFVGSTIRVLLDFLVWPSSPDLKYSLSTAMGSIGSASKIVVPQEFSLFIDNRTEIDLPYWMEDVTIYWETPTFDRNGTEIPTPTHVLVNNNVLRFSTEVFGSIRISGTALGYGYTITMDLDKPVESIPTPEDYSIYPEDVIIWGVPSAKTVFNAPKIENLENTITATWTDRDEAETEQLRLVIPPCVESLLKMCPDMYQTLTLLCSTVATQQVYYNACTGEIMYVVDGIDPQRICTPISGRVTANPWGMGTL
jgi:hypothetical protein